MVLYDSFIKTRKIEITKLRRPGGVPDEGRAAAGIPKALVDGRADPLQSLFRTDSELKRFKKALTLMLNDPKGGFFLNVRSGQGRVGHGAEFDGEEDEADGRQSGRGGAKWTRAGRVKHLDAT